MAALTRAAAGVTVTLGRRLASSAAGAQLLFPSVALLLHKHRLNLVELGMGSGLRGSITKGDVLKFLASPRARAPAPAASAVTAPSFGAAALGDAAHLGHIFARKDVALSAASAHADTDEGIERLIVTAASRALARFPEFSAPGTAVALHTLGDDGALTSTLVDPRSMLSASGRADFSVWVVTRSGLDSLGAALSAGERGSLCVGTIVTSVRLAESCAARPTDSLSPRGMASGVWGGGSGSARTTTRAHVPLTLTVDSRVADTARAAAYLERVAALLAEPETMLV